MHLEESLRLFEYKNFVWLELYCVSSFPININILIYPCVQKISKQDFGDLLKLYS